MLRCAVSELLFAGSFELSVQSAAASHRWLLVNVQEPTEFSCTLLNRDVWRHGAMRRLLEGPLLLKQLMARSAEGLRYKTFYHARREPHIAIIDPRTRQKMWSWSAHDDTHTTSHHEPAVIEMEPCIVSHSLCAAMAVVAV